MLSSNNKECDELLRSLGFDEYGVDSAYLLMLQVVGAIIQLDFNESNKIGNVKRLVFWKTLSQISSHEINKSYGKDAGELTVGSEQPSA